MSVKLCLRKKHAQHTQLTNQSPKHEDQAKLPVPFSGSPPATLLLTACLLALLPPLLPSATFPLQPTTFPLQTASPLPPSKQVHGS
jgi:hypothetical protein